MVKKGLRRDPLEGIPYGVNALIRNEGATIEEVAIAEIDLSDETFRVRRGEMQDLLAESLSQVGQLNPVTLRYREKDGRWQVVAGFRRLEALQRMARRGVLARLHDNLNDDQAIRSAVMDNFFSGGISGEDLDTFIERLTEQGLMNSEIASFLDWARERIGRVVSAHPVATPASGVIPSEAAPATSPDPDDGLSISAQVDQTFSNLSEAAQGLERLFLNWSDVSASDRKLLAGECKYLHDIYPFLTR